VPEDPPDPVSLADLRIEPFRENLDVRNFDSGDKDLNDFLTTHEVWSYESEVLVRLTSSTGGPRGSLPAISQSQMRASDSSIFARSRVSQFQGRFESK
jgi:hypothetical protein